MQDALRKAKEDVAQKARELVNLESLWTSGSRVLRLVFVFSGSSKEVQLHSYQLTKTKIITNPSTTIVEQFFYY